MVKAVIRSSPWVGEHETEQVIEDEKWKRLVNSQGILSRRNVTLMRRGVPQHPGRGDMSKTTEVGLEGGHEPSRSSPDAS